MRAGSMKHRISIQSNTRATDANGSPVETWVNVATIWADAKTLTGREKWAGEHIAREYDLSFQIRYRSDITQSMRVIYNNRTLEINSIVDISERRRTLVLLCRELKNG